MHAKDKNATEHFNLYVKYLISRKKTLVCCSTFIKECINLQDMICVEWPCSSTADSNAHSFNSRLLVNYKIKRYIILLFLYENSTSIILRKNYTIITYGLSHLPIIGISVISVCSVKSVTYRIYTRKKFLTWPNFQILIKHEICFCFMFDPNKDYSMNFVIWNWNIVFQSWGIGKCNLTGSQSNWLKNIRLGSLCTQETKVDLELSSVTDTLLSCTYITHTSSAASKEIDGNFILGYKKLLFRNFILYGQTV